jgi:hypothetical protein
MQALCPAIDIDNLLSKSVFDHRMETTLTDAKVAGRQVLELRVQGLCILAILEEGGRVNGNERSRQCEWEGGETEGKDRDGEHGAGPIAEVKV